MGGTQVCGGWFDRNSPHRARGLLGDRKLEEPPRDFPTGLGIDPRDLSAAHHFLQVNYLVDMGLWHWLPGFSSFRLGDCWAVRGP